MSPESTELLRERFIAEVTKSLPDGVPVQPVIRAANTAWLSGIKPVLEDPNKLFAQPYDSSAQLSFAEAL